ncbi:MAG: hypothetical protein HY908_19255 [Myxococcales bacterium]|nr:hypothetical protein [Myxococcales bacterium]
MLWRTHVWIAFAAAITAGCALPEAAKIDGAATGGSGGSTGTGGAGGMGGGGSSVIGPVGLASTSAVVAATGMAQQTHIVFADGRYRLFYLDGSYPQQVRVRTSPDFVGWSDAAPLQLPADHGLEGRNLAVAHDPLNDHVHLTLSYSGGTNRSRLHARAAFSDDVVSFEPPVVVHTVSATAAPELAIDAPLVGITSDGRPFGTSGYHDDGAGAAAGSSFLWWADDLDLGELWQNAWTAPPVVLEAVPAFVHARAAAGGANGGALVFWEQAVDEPYGGNVRYALSTPGVPNAALNAFAPGGLQHPNDWNVVAVTPTEIHIVRRVLGPAQLQHRIFTPGTSFTDGPSIAPIELAEGGGLLLASDGDGVLLVGIRDDDSVVAARWSRDTGLPGSWGPWTDVATTPAKRTFLGGNAVAVGGRAAVVWTEGDPPALAIVGALVSVASPPP